MPATQHNLLKSTEVKIEGVFKLDIAPAAAPQARCHSPAPEQTAPQVVVAESYPDFAVLEVTCPCGRKLFVKCLYGSGMQQPPRQQQDPVLENNAIDQEN